MTNIAQPTDGHGYSAKELMKERHTVDSVITHTSRDGPRGMAYGKVWVLTEALKLGFEK